MNKWYIVKNIKDLINDYIDGKITKEDIMIIDLKSRELLEMSQIEMTVLECPNDFIWLVNTV